MRNAKKKPASGATTSSKSSTSRSTPTSPMNVGLLEQLVKLMSANDLNTVEIRDGNQRVVLKRGAVAPTYAYAPAAPAPAAAPVAASAGTGAAGAPATATVASDDANLVAIKSPMVGTFYTAATPEAKPFVSVGTRVDEDTDVCIIEAMKVFNNIKAETRGTITKVLVTNGQTVEFGQTLYLVKP